MVQMWRQSEGGIEVCPGCGVRYKVTIHRGPARDKDQFHRRKCGVLVRDGMTRTGLRLS